MNTQTETLRIPVTNVYKRNALSSARFLVNIGGARSSKSYSIAQLLIERFINQSNKAFLISRKTGPALRLTAYKLILDLLKKYELYEQLEHDRSHSIITNPFNGNYIAFVSVDDPEKIKSTEWNYIWLEEASEFTWEDWLILQTRLSGQTVPEQPNQVFLSLNPTDEQGWINQRLMLLPQFVSRMEIIESNYKDNPFLDDDYIQLLESLKEQDPNAYRIYALGQWGILSNIIFPPPEPVQHCPDSFQDIVYGLDFGFNAPTALIECGIQDETKVYLKELLYETRLTNQEFIGRLKQLIPEDKRHYPIYADAEDPNRIEEIYAAGFNVHPADKGKDSVKAGIDVCKSFKFYTLPDNINLNKEWRNYKWKTDKNGNVLDEPVKFLDHACFVAGTPIFTKSGLIPIEDVQPGEFVWTRSGWQPVIAAGLSKRNAFVREYNIDGTRLTATDNHPIYANGTFKPIGRIGKGDVLCRLKLSNIAGKCGGDTKSRQTDPTGFTLGPRWMGAHLPFTDTFGKWPMAKFQQGTTSTTRMETHWTTGLKTLSVSMERSICQNTGTRTNGRILKDVLNIWNLFAGKQRYGMEAMQGNPGTVNMEKESPPLLFQSKRNVRNAIKSIRQRCGETGRGFAQTNASQPAGEMLDLILRREDVCSVESDSWRTGLERMFFVQSVVRGVITGKRYTADVYNITVAGKPEYFANGILSHNCDAVRYALFTHTKGRRNAPGIWVID